jgi:hypothetical protein
MEHGASQPNETLEAIRFLWAMVGVSANVVDLVDYEVGPSGERFTCRNMASGALVSVSRPRRWTEDEERRFVDALDQALNGDDGLADIEDRIDWMPAERELVTS